MNSLFGSQHLIDEQHLLVNPLLINHLSDRVTLETGLSTTAGTTTANSNGESFFLRTIDENSKLGLFVGHQDPGVVFTRNLVNIIGFKSYDMQHNPIELIYGLKDVDVYYSVSLAHSGQRDRVSVTGEATNSVSLGLEAGHWQGSVRYALVNTVSTAASRFDGAGRLDFNFRFLTDNLQAYVLYFAAPARSRSLISEEESHNIQKLTLGIVDSNFKDGNDPFWSVEIVTLDADCQLRGSLTCKKAARSIELPLTLGFEAKAQSWLTLRGSIRQNFLVSQSKDDVGYIVGTLPFATGGLSDFTSGPNSTQVGLGAGLVFDRLRFDGSLAAATSQRMNSTNFLTQLSAIYEF